MGEYEKCRWSPGPPLVSRFSIERRAPAPSNSSSSRIKLEPTDTTVLLGLRPILCRCEGRLSARSEPYRLIDPPIRPPIRSYDYDVWVHADPTSCSPTRASHTKLHEMTLQVPEGLKTSFEGDWPSPLSRIFPPAMWSPGPRLESYLLDPGRFGYTLQMDVIALALTRSRTFFVNRKDANCAYFRQRLVADAALDRINRPVWSRGGVRAVTGTPVHRAHGAEEQRP